MKPRTKVGIALLYIMYIIGALTDEPYILLVISLAAEGAAQVADLGGQRLLRLAQRRPGAPLAARGRAAGPFYLGPPVVN